MSETPDRFPGLTHEQALAATLPETALIVDHLIEAGTLGTIAGLPESHKSFLAMEIAVKVAANRGRVLGEFDVVDGGCHCSYWWQDDSEANELRRIQDYAMRNGFKTGVDLTWHLNQGLRLPDDMDELAVEARGAGLIVLDSLYNFLGAGALKDEDVATIYAALKACICDELGASVLVVDHAPWPSESNRGQRRAYGSVFKAASIRWGIYLVREADGKLWIEARGNNLAGFSRRLAAWDEDALELRLVEAKQQPSSDERKLGDLVADWLAKNPDAVTPEVREGVRRSAAAVRQTLHEDPRFALAPRQPGDKAETKRWRLTPVPDSATESGRVGQPPAQTSDCQTADPSPPLRGGRSRDGQARVPDSPAPNGLVETRMPGPGDADFPDFLNAAFAARFITDRERYERRLRHDLLVHATRREDTDEEAHAA